MCGLESHVEEERSRPFVVENDVCCMLSECRLQKAQEGELFGEKDSKSSSAKDLMLLLRVRFVQ